MPSAEEERMRVALRRRASIEAKPFMRQTCLGQLFAHDDDSYVEAMEGPHTVRAVTRDPKMRAKLKAKAAAARRASIEAKPDVGAALSWMETSALQEGHTTTTTTAAATATATATAQEQPDMPSAEEERKRAALRRRASIEAKPFMRRTCLGQLFAHDDDSYVEATEGPHTVRAVTRDPRSQQSVEAKAAAAQGASIGATPDVGAALSSMEASALQEGHTTTTTTATATAATATASTATATATAPTVPGPPKPTKPGAGRNQQPSLPHAWQSFLEHRQAIPSRSGNANEASVSMGESPEHGAQQQQQQAMTKKEGQESSDSKHISRLALAWKQFASVPSAPTASTKTARIAATTASALQKWMRRRKPKLTMRNAARQVQAAVAVGRDSSPGVVPPGGDARAEAEAAMMNAICSDKPMLAKVLRFISFLSSTNNITPAEKQKVILLKYC